MEKVFYNKARFRKKPVSWFVQELWFSCSMNSIYFWTHFKRLRPDFTEQSNKLKEIAGNNQQNCLGVSDYYPGAGLQGLAT